MTVTLGAREARARFSELLERAQGGESIVITRNGREAARIGPPRGRPARRGGWLTGKIWKAPDWEDTPPEVLEAVERDLEPR